MLQHISLQHSETENGGEPGLTEAGDDTVGHHDVLETLGEAAKTEAEGGDESSKDTDWPGAPSGGTGSTVFRRTFHHFINFES